MCPPSPHYYPPPPPPPPSFPRNARRQMESQKIYTMHIIKNADTENPSVHSFPVDAEALPDVTLEHMRALSSEQLSFISSHLSKLNDELTAASKSEAAATPPAPACAPYIQEEAKASDYETPWVLEGVDIPLEPKTVYVRAAEDVSGRRRRFERPAGDSFGVNSWKPVQGPYKEIVAVYSRNICSRGAWIGAYYRRRSRSNLRDTVWRVEPTPPPPPPMFPIPPPPPPPVRTVDIRRGRDYESESDDEIVV